jgi:hypothetical protein
MQTMMQVIGDGGVRDRQLVGGLWFAWGMRWKIGQWWHMIRQMGDGNYEAR